MASPQLRSNLPWATALVAAVLLGGCQKSDDQQVTAASSKYEVGEDDSSSSSGSGASGSPTTPTAPPSGLAGSPPTSPPTTPGTSPSGTAAPTPPTGSSTPSKPPVIPGAALDEYTPPPNATAEQLWAFIEQLQPRRERPRGSTPQQMILDLQNMLSAQIQAAEMILQKSDADPKLRQGSVEVKLSCLRDLANLGVGDAQQHIVEFCKALQSDQDADIARLGRLLSFSLDAGEVIEGRSKDPQPVVDMGLKLLASEEKTDQVFQHLRTVAISLMEAGHHAPGKQLVDAVIAGFESSEKESIIAQVQMLREESRFLDLQMPAKLQAFVEDGPDALATLAKTTEELLSVANPGVGTLEQAVFIGNTMERKEQFEAAKTVYQQIESAYAEAHDEDLKKMVQETMEYAERRLSLLSQPLTLQGKLSTGQDLDFSQYKNKVVLVSFWSANNPYYLQYELPRLKQLHDVYQKQGFEIIGVNIDEDRRLLDQFFQLQPLPWPTVMGNVDGANLIEAFGLTAVPFNILVDRQGTVVALHVNPATLPEKLPALIGTPDAGSPTTENKDAAPPANPGTDNPGADNPGADNRKDPGDCGGEAAIVEDEEPQAADAAVETDNPYLARADMDRTGLVDFLFDMEEKPRSIRERAGFDEALLDAADRILAGGRDDQPALIAAEVKLQTLHRRAVLQVDGAEQQLQEAIAGFADDQRPSLASEVKFLSIEQKLLAVDDLPLDQVPALLEQVQELLAEQTAGERHLRLASATVHAINRLDVEKREAYFQQFGQLFAKSSDRQLASYGRRVAATEAAPELEIIGQSLELAGATALGVELNWAGYRGKVVLVDFWATWCGPCRRETPLIKNLYEKYRDRGLEVVGVNLDKSNEALAKYLEEQAIPWNNLVGQDARAAAERYGIRGIPTLMLVDREGKVVAVSHRSSDLLASLDEMITGK